MEWYNTLTKAPLTPPSHVFRIVWPLLYILMAISFFRFLARGGSLAGGLAFFVQLAMTLVWPFLFFEQRRVCASVVLVVSLVLMTMVTMWSFHSVDRLSTHLLAPYVLWLLFATYLNAYICWANRTPKE